MNWNHIGKMEWKEIQNRRMVQNIEELYKIDSNSNNTHIGFENLPEEIIIYLTKYLKGYDTVRLSSASKHFYNTLNCDTVWNNLMKREGLRNVESITKAAETEFCNNNSLETSITKSQYILHKKVHANWKNGKSQKCFKSAYRMSASDDYLITLSNNQSITESIQQPLARFVSYGGWSPFGEIKPNTNYLLNIYDLRKIGLKTPLYKDVHLSKLLSHKQFLYKKHLEKILVFGDSLVVIFGSELGYNKLVVLDISNALKEIWSDDDHECVGKRNKYVGSNEIIHFSRKHGNFYRINFGLKSIEVRHILTNHEENRWNISNDIEINGQDISSDEKYLIMTGISKDASRQFAETSCLVGWNITNGELHTYLSDRPLQSPKNTFFQSKISGEMVYGILEREALYIWNKHTSELLNTVEFGEHEVLSHRCLATLQSKYFVVFSDDKENPPFLVTINQNFRLLTILDRQGHPSIELGWHELISGVPSNFRNVILDVVITETHLVVYYIDQSDVGFSSQLGTTKFIVFPLPLASTPDDTLDACMNIGPSFCMELGVNVDSNGFNNSKVDHYVTVTPTKIIHCYERLGVNIYDFLLPKINGNEILI